MAATKSKSRSTSSKSKTSSSSSRNGSSQAKKKSSSNRSRASSNRRAPSSSRQKSTAKASSNGTDGSKLAAFADKAKAPAAAGGAALVGLAGGLALGRSRRRNGLRGRLAKSSLKMPRVRAPKVSLPKPDSALKAVGSAAGTIAERSKQVERVASHVHQASDAIAKER
jgi:hypothetical protein